MLNKCAKAEFVRLAQPNDERSIQDPLIALGALIEVGYQYA